MHRLTRTQLIGFTLSLYSICTPLFSVLGEAASESTLKDVLTNTTSISEATGTQPSTTPPPGGEQYMNGSILSFLRDLRFWNQMPCTMQQNSESETPYWECTPPAFSFNDIKIDVTGSDSKHADDNPLFPTNGNEFYKKNQWKSEDNTALRVIVDALNTSTENVDELVPSPSGDDKKTALAKAITADDNRSYSFALLSSLGDDTRAAYNEDGSSLDTKAQLWLSIMKSLATGQQLAKNNISRYAGAPNDQVGEKLKAIADSYNNGKKPPNMGKVLVDLLKTNLIGQQINYARYKLERDLIVTESAILAKNNITTAAQLVGPNFQFPYDPLKTSD